MKCLIALISFASVSAFASQTITCQQISKDGSLRKKGIAISLITKQGSAAIVKGLEGLEEQVVRSIHQGTAINGKEFTTIFLLPKFDDGMLDLQLQFDAHVLRRNFSGVKATYVVGSDASEPEVAFAHGYDMICDGKK